MPGMAHRRHRFLCIFRGDIDQHPDPGIEDTCHFHGRDRTFGHQPSEKRRQIPAFKVKIKGKILPEGAGRVFDQPAAGDMRKPVNAFHLAKCGHHFGNRFHIDGCWLKHGAGQCLSLAERGVIMPVEPAARDNLADQRKTIGMGAGGADGNRHIASTGSGRVNHLAALKRPDTEPRQIITAIRIDTRHFGCLATDQRTAGQHASIGDPGDDFGGDAPFQPAGGIIVKKEQRHRSLRQHIIGTHGNQINAQVAVMARSAGDFELGADAIGCRYQYRIDITGGLEIKHGAKTAKGGIGTRPGRAAGIGADILDEGVAFVDIHPCGTIGKGDVFVVILAYGSLLFETWSVVI